MADTGMTIGIATTAIPRWHELQSGRRVRRPSLQFIRIAEAARVHGASVVLFNPKEVDWEKRTVNGWVAADALRLKGEWVQRRVAIPNVIYENVYVHLAVKGYSSELRRQAMRRGIPLFNPILPGKWRMVHLLQQSGLKSYSPETERLSDIAQLKDRLRKWRTVYVKPVGGYGGMDVNRVELMSDGRYRVSVDRSRSNGGKSRSIFSEAQLEKWIQLKRNRAYLLQRGLDLMTVGGRKIDFRVVLHRDRQGIWQLIGIIPKMAANDGVVTNIIAGGERHDMTSLELQARREGKQIPIAALEAQSKEIAEAISKRYPSCGLIGFDMAVEQDGSVKMIEMNPKPARSLLSLPMLERLAEHTAGFAVFLAKRQR